MTITATPLRQLPTEREIERVWLLRSLPVLPARAVPLRIEQGYFPRRDRPRDMRGRLRRTIRPDGGVVYHHTIKRGKGLVRREYERAISREIFEEFWSRTRKLRVSKIRHEVREGALVWQVDVFDEPRGLVLAEVELPTPETHVTPPTWLADYVVREVTEDSRYTSRAIARALAGDPGHHFE
ncbi:MAG: hypothetical protein ACR2GY_02380 [Phycisphaerales bacterium]